MNIRSLLNAFGIVNYAPIFQVYTDGSQKGRWGSWAFVVLRDAVVVKECSGRIRKTNSHRMEFQAAIEAIRSLPARSTATIHTDSRELIKAVLASDMQPRANSDQIEILRILLLQHNISWQWIKAHSGKTHNERCNELCVLARSISS